jgi:hypothetical protein
MTFALELAAVVVVALWALRSSRSPSFEKWGFVVSLVLLCSLSGAVWAHFAGYLRASGETLVFAVAVLIGARTRVLFWASVPLITLSVHLAVKEMAPVVGVVLGIAIAVTAAATARGALAQRGAARA